MGMYKVSKELLEKSKYSTSQNNEDMFSEHLFFNKNFSRLDIFTNGI